MSLFSAPPKSLCILRLSAIGDVCNAIAAVQAIQKQWPSTSLTWIAGKTEASLLQALLPEVRVIAYDKKQGIKGMRAIWQQLKHEHFDALLHMQTAIRASLLSIGVKARYKLGFDHTRSSDLQQWFTNVKVPSPVSLHVLDGFMAFTEQLGIAPQTPRWQINLANELQQWAKQQLTDKPLFIIAPSSSKAFKNWNVDGYVAVIKHAQSQGFSVMLIGSAADNEQILGQQIVAKLEQEVINLIGKTSLLQLLALIQQASLVLAPDSGPVHLANAVGTPVIGLYAHHNPKRTGPYQYQDYVVTAFEAALLAETGKTAAEVNWRTRVKDNNAMDRISNQQVIDRFDQVVSKEGLLA